MGALDIGAEAIDRPSQAATNYTFIAADNPCNGDGEIDTVEIWAATAMSGVEVAIFYKTDGSTFSTRANHTIGNVAAGSKISTPVSLSVKAGDYIGFYCSGGAIERNTSGGQGWWYKSGDNIPCTGAAFTYEAANIISLKGTGSSPAGGSKALIIG